MLLQRQLMDCVAVTRVTVHFDTVAIAAGNGLWSPLPSGIQRYNRNCNLCAH